MQEILGSSLGEPSLVLELAEIPVLPETVELRVREELSEDEREVLEEARRRVDPDQRPSGRRATGRRDGGGRRRHLGALATCRLLHRHRRRRAGLPARSGDRAGHLRQRTAGQGPAGGERRRPRLPLPARRRSGGQRARVERRGGEVGAGGDRVGGAAGGRGGGSRQPRSGRAPRVGAGTPAHRRPCRDGGRLRVAGRRGCCPGRPSPVHPAHAPR